MMYKKNYLQLLKAIYGAEIPDDLDVTPKAVVVIDWHIQNLPGERSDVVQLKYGVGNQNTTKTWDQVRDVLKLPRERLYAMRNMAFTILGCSQHKRPIFEALGLQVK